jgi:hypothetical protein
MTAMVQFTDAAGIVPHLAREEAERRHQYYLGPEHLLLGLLVENDTPAVRELRAAGVHLDVDNPAARVLRTHGLNSETVRAGIDRLIAEGVLPGPQPSDTELLATLGIDLDAIYARLKETFGWEAYYYAAQRVRLRPIQPFPHAPGAWTPLICWRVFVLVRQEAAARGEDATPCTGCSRCSGTPRTRSRSTSTATRWKAASGRCLACPTTAPARSGCSSSPKG